jgi:hypothetical protein
MHDNFIVEFPTRDPTPDELNKIPTPPNWKTSGLKYKNKIKTKIWRFTNARLVLQREDSKRNSVYDYLDYLIAFPNWIYDEYKKGVITKEDIKIKRIRKFTAIENDEDTTNKNIWPEKRKKYSEDHEEQKRMTDEELNDYYEK